MLFAWTVCRRVRSNAIVIAKDGATLGIGAGQMSRVDSVRLAVEKCREAGAEPAACSGSALASDAYFPFADGPRRHQSRRHRRDPARRLETRRRRDRGLRRAGVAMVFTRRRHFRH